jgi:hypothetical protein
MANLASELASMSRFAFLAALIPLVLAGCRASCARVCCPRTAAAPPSRTPTAPPPAAAVSGVSPAAAAALEADRAILEHLRSKRVLDLQWNDETKISDAVAYLRTITGRNFFITPKAQTEKEDVRVPLMVDNVSAADILDIITSQNGMQWEVRDGLVRIATIDEVSGSYLLRFYDVNDLQVVIPSFLEKPRLDVPGAVPEPSVKNEDSVQREERARWLVVTIRTLIDPEVWIRADAKIEQKKGVLIARAPPATLEKIQRYLDTLRAATVPP